MNKTQILAAIKPVTVPVNNEVARLTVNETISKFSFLYERIRNAVDYKDDHLIRKAAILRILKRQLMLETDPTVIADRLVRELIGARYLPNGVLPESTIQEIAKPIKKLWAVLQIKAGSERHSKWLQGITAVEIEELLVDPTNEKAFVTFLYDRVADSISLRGAELDDTERRLQVYVACYRSLIKADDQMLGYKLLRAYLPEWQRSDEWLDNPRPIAERLFAVEKRIHGRLNHPLSQRFLRVVKPWAVSLSLLREVLFEKKTEAAALLDNPTDLRLALERRAEERYALSKSKLRRGTVRAMVYLFVTKMLVALVLEIPIETLWYEKFSYLSLGINLIFPPAMMLIIGLMISVPGRENTDRLLAGVDELLSESLIPKREVRAIETRVGLTGLMFSVAYAATFLLSFGLVALVLNALNFTWVSGVIFIFFLCVVSFFAFRLRFNAREIVVVDDKQGFFSLLIDFLSLPILRAGRWLSRSISRINIFLFIFDFLFEAPFKIFLSVLEEWFGFLKEKKDELQ